MGSKTHTLTRFIVLFSGGLNSLLALTILLAPEFFYNTLANFAPFNRHFLGDIAAFMIGPSLALLFAAREPGKHRALIGAVVLSNLVHLANHLYDDIFVERGATLHWLNNTVPVLITTLPLLWVWFTLKPSK